MLPATGLSAVPRRFITVLALVALAASSWVFASSASAQATCFGRAATIFATPGVTTHGTSGSDVIVGTPGPDIIRAHRGRDYICSGDGDDRVYGGYGRDSIDLGPGADYARGGPAGDYIEGGPGADLIRGRGGRDTINAEGGIDKCYGGAGADSLYSCNESPQSEPAASAPAAAGLTGAENQMVGLVNDLRIANGLSPLTVSLDISQVARNWSVEMTSGFRHNVNVGSQIPTGWSWWGENIAYNVSVAANFNALVNSPGHYANMVNSGFTHIGVGVHVDGNRVYVTQVFATY